MLGVAEGLGRYKGVIDMIPTANAPRRCTEEVSTAIQGRHSMKHGIHQGVSHTPKSPLIVWDPQRTVTQTAAHLRSPSHEMLTILTVFIPVSHLHTNKQNKQKCTQNGHNFEQQCRPKQNFPVPAIPSLGLTVRIFEHFGSRGGWGGVGGVKPNQGELSEGAGGTFGLVCRERDSGWSSLSAARGKKPQRRGDTLVELCTGNGMGR